MTTIGFVGLGHMGKPMASNLIKASCKLYVHDVVPDAVNALTSLGATRATNVVELSKAVDIIITMVQTSQQVRSITDGDAGLFKNAKPNTLYIDCSSIDIADTKRLHQEARAAGIAMLDAPVSGGVAGAEAATLTFMVGGEAADFKRAEPLLSKMGKKIIHAGPAGSGQAAKIANNLLLAISMIGVSEAFNLAEKLGLDAQKFFEISSNASGQCWSMTTYCPAPGILPKAPSSNDYRPGFMTKMMLKDLRLAIRAAENVAAPLPLGSLATELYTLYNNTGNSETDFSGIINFIKGKH